MINDYYLSVNVTNSLVFDDDDSIDIEETDYEYPYNVITVELFDDEKLVAVARVFNIKAYLAEDKDEIIDIADSFHGDALTAIETLFDFEDYDSSVEYVEYLDHLHVEEEYRQQGIGKWLFKNLEMILYSHCNIDSAFICTIPVPDGNMEIEQPEKKAIMVNTMESVGFKNIPHTNVWYK